MATRNSEERKAEYYEMEVSTKVVTISDQPEAETMLSGQNGRARSRSERYVTHENAADVKISKGTRRVLYALKFIMGVLLFGLVLTCSMFSKLTLVSITDRLRTATWNISTEPKAQIETDTDTAASLYWQLFFIMFLPNAIAFGRSFVFGVFGKTKKSFPWPKPIAVVLGLILSAVEVLAINVFVFLVLSYLPPDISILLLNGVFLAQIAIDVLRTPCKPSSEIRNGYNDLELTTDSNSLLRSEKMKQFSGRIRMLFENKSIKLIALGLHFAGIVCLAVYMGIMMQEHGGDKLLRSMIAFPLVLVAISVIWSDPVQHWMANTKKKVDEFHSARYKSSFINSGFKMLLYPFVSYLVFRFFTPHRVDPWCLYDSCNLNLAWSSDLLATFLVQILTTLFAYIFVWIACTMTLHWCGLALPLILSTPASIAWYYISIAVTKEGDNFFPSYNPHDAFNEVYPVAPLIASALWLSEVLAMGYYLWTRSNIILSKDTAMFLTPYYDGVFLEQQIMLNRQTTKGKNQGRREEYRGYPIERPPRTIFICSTMYRENDIEMRQMLTSIYRVAHHFEKQQEANPNGEFDRFESHIFFDGAINGTQLTQFALQLISLLEDTVKVRLKDCRREKTPYGYRLTWYLGSNDRGMPFTVHMKDNLKVKNKKRWSQVMYMNYVIKYRIQKDGLDPTNTFILTTDADIDFTSESAVVLLDMLASNEKVGAVCARTHPKGSGPVYWYQIFDYAIGHWLQKPAEHILGCVLCCPGCFSVFRCSALKEVMEEYSSDVTSAVEFLTKDMGEDRWLCTLLIQRGWRLEYCAISEDYTYCPVTFDEFFKQRRRWIPSTIANLALLISEAGSITRGNDTVSILFILFQALMVFSTAISPATVILVIATGLQSAYKLSDDITITLIAVLIVMSVIYGIICLYTSQKTQLEIAKLMTFIFSIIMAIVFAGIFKDTVNGLIPSPKLTFLQPPNCSNFLNPLGPNGSISYTDSEGYENCVKAARYLGSLPNTVGNPGFKLPVSTSTLYLGVLALVFVVAAVLHFSEFSCLLQFIWYILALPSGYLLLLIYSAANLNSQSWGTREGKSGSGGITDKMRKCFKAAWGKMLLCFVRCCGDKKENGNREEPPPQVPESKKDSPPPPSIPIVPVTHKPVDPEARQWLIDLECEHYVENFEEHGYTNKHFISSMDSEDFKAIGIDKRGFKLRLEKAAKKLPSLPIETDIPRSVEEWLGRLELEEYTELFHAEGYKTEEDVENLKDLTSDELRAIGIHKRAHLQRLQNALKRLFYPSSVELEIRRTKSIIENVPIMHLGGAHHVQDGLNEADFWDDLIHRKLKPVTVRFTLIDDIKDMLKSLRNSILAVLLLINLTWIILLYTLQFPQLEDYGLEPRAFQLLFLAVYSIIIAVQFVALVCHRGVTLVHYLGRTQPAEIIGPVNEDPLVVSMPAARHQAV